MKDKHLLTMASPYLEVSCQETTAPLPCRPGGRLSRFLERVAWLFKGKKNEVSAPDPALAILARIGDLQVRKMVKELHFLTPPSLKTMRDICPSCFFLPEDCPYVDYSIPDVRKAVKRIDSHPVFAARPEAVIRELNAVNPELAYHLREHYGLNE